MAGDQPAITDERIFSEPLRSRLRGLRSCRPESECENPANRCVKRDFRHKLAVTHSGDSTGENRREHCGCKRKERSVCSDCAGKPENRPRNAADQ